MEPAAAAPSPAHESAAQADLRAELKESGLKICYQSCRDGNNELYVMDADGRNDHKITDTTDIRESYPHVSPDGRRVCFRTLSAHQGKWRYDVYWMNVDGSGRTSVASDATDPCWDPAGVRIMFVKRLPDSETFDYKNTGLYVHDTQTGRTEEVTDGELYHAYVPCWSPAGDWAVATVHEHAQFGHALVALDLRTGRISSLKRTAKSGCRPDLSWDGKMLCWNADDYHIFVAPFDPTSTEKNPGHAIAEAPEGGSVYYGDWSPDGRYIAYAMTPDVESSHPVTRGPWDIFVTRAEGGACVQITFDHAHNKQPDFFLPR